MKTVLLVTARLKSSRLPMKVIKPIQGRPMFCHLLDRLKLAKRPQQIVVCTSPLAQDDPLEELARQEGVPCFRGDPVDVLQRLTDAARQFGADVVLNVTADNPFADPEYLDRLADFHVQNGNDYSRTAGLPLGCYGWALSLPAMVKACEIKSDQDTEIWGVYFTESGMFRWGVLEVDDPAVSWPELRVTVDTPEDFEPRDENLRGTLQAGRSVFLAGNRGPLPAPAGTRGDQCECPAANRAADPLENEDVAVGNSP